MPEVRQLRQEGRNGPLQASAVEKTPASVHCVLGGCLQAVGRAGLSVGFSSHSLSPSLPGSFLSFPFSAFYKCKCLSFSLLELIAKGDLGAL